MKKAFRVLTAALLAVQSMTSLHTVQADAKTESDRITIENGTFMYEGEPFISIGATDYGRLNSSYAHIEQSISDMAAHGLNTLRMCDYLENVYDTENLSDYRDEALWTQIDFMLYQAEQYGLKVIPSCCRNGCLPSPMLLCRIGKQEICAGMTGWMRLIFV